MVASSLNLWPSFSGRVGDSLVVQYNNSYLAARKDASLQFIGPVLGCSQAAAIFELPGACLAVLEVLAWLAGSPSVWALLSKFIGRGSLHSSSYKDALAFAVAFLGCCCRVGFGSSSYGCWVGRWLLRLGWSVLGWLFLRSLLVWSSWWSFWSEVAGPMPGGHTYKDGVAPPLVWVISACLVWFPRGSRAAAEGFLFEFLVL
ncbi:hypothetical protein U1Q18_040907 [Sarracenia purpurea var. burkii]